MAKKKNKRIPGLTKGAQRELEKVIRKLRKADPASLISVAKSINPPPDPWRYARPSYLRDPEFRTDMRKRVAGVGGQSPVMITKAAGDPGLRALEHLRTSPDPAEREMYFRAAAKSQGGAW